MPSRKRPSTPRLVGDPVALRLVAWRRAPPRIGVSPRTRAHDGPSEGGERAAPDLHDGQPTMSLHLDADRAPDATPHHHAVPPSHRKETESERLRVLFVTPYLPSPPKFGGQQRMHAILSGLARSHEVSVLSLVDPAESQDEARRVTESYCARVVTVPNHRYAASGMTKRALQLASVLSLRSNAWLTHRIGAFSSALEEMLASERYDVVHFSFAQTAICGLGVKRAPGGPAFCVDEHNIEYDLVRRTSEAGKTLPRRFYSAVDWRKLRAEERKTWTLFDGCTVTSPRDEALVRADSPTTRTAIVPNGVDLEHLSPVHGEPAEGPPSLLFFGAIDYHPNTDGLLFFLREVMPLLVARYPALKLSIVGRRPPPSILAFRGPNVEVTGVVDDLRPYMARATAVLAPLFIGGGTRLKILEAMAMGKPIVSTSLGAEGLAVKHDEHLLLADDAPAFAREVGRLIDYPLLGRKLGEAARALVVARYGWRASVDRLGAFYSDVLRARAG